MKCCLFPNYNFRFGKCFMALPDFGVTGKLYTKEKHATREEHFFWD